MSISNSQLSTLNFPLIPPGYKQTEVGVIPEDWACEELSKFFSFISYGFTNPMPTVHDGVFMITAADINYGRLQLEGARKTSESAYRALLTAKSKPRANDVLLTKDGTLGRLALVGEETICINQSVAVIRPNGRVEPLFLKLLLESPRYQKRMVEDAGGSTIKHIYITIVDKMPLGLPLERSEQHAIATALSDVDALLTSLDQLITKKRDLKQAAMQQLLTGQTRLPGFHGEWEVKALARFCNQVTTGKLDANAMSLNGEYRFYTCAKDFYYIDTYAFDCEALLISGNGANVGYIHYYEGKFNAYQRTYVLSGFSVSIKYIRHYLSQKLAERIAVEVKAGGTPYITRGTITEMLINLPPTKSEQTAIAQVLTDMDAELSALEQRRDKTRALKQAMMQELLTGKTRLVTG